MLDRRIIAEIFSFPDPERTFFDSITSLYILNRLTPTIEPGFIISIYNPTAKFPFIKLFN